MLTYYCPNCWKIITKEQSTCLECGYALAEFDNKTYEEKLIAALNHIVPERAIIAAEILGIRQSQNAIPALRKILESGETNYFLLRAVLLAVVKIDHPERRQILQKAAHHQSDMAARLAGDLLEKLDHNDKQQDWDHHTG